ncbi:MAG: hypothetical protein HOL08_07990 [Opitutae bacterium]|jgi:hypothetical protein|nr:hypothetical protein [Opitutae bacterium]
MGLLDFLSKSDNVMVNADRIFPEIDLSALIKKLRILERGKEQGNLNLPETDNETFDSVEQQIIHEVSTVENWQFNTYIERQKVYVDRSRDAAVQGLVNDTRAAVNDAVTDFSRHIHNGVNELFVYKREVIETETELKAFRVDHNLSRPARYYSGRTYKIGVLFVILLVEAVLNGVFLSKGSEFGLIGGIFEALIIASINVIWGLAIGRLALPRLAYRGLVSKILGIVLVIFGGALAFGFNLGVAHYRTAMSGDPFEASLIAYQTLILHPFGIGDIKSWGLFFIGMTFSSIAALDGWLMDDPYPGYGQRTRQNVEALNAYTELKGELLDEIEGIKNDAEEKIDQLAMKVKDRREELASLLVRSLTLRRQFEQHFSHIELTVNAALAAYRDENRRFRTVTSPPSFSLQWSCPRQTLDDYSILIKSDDATNTSVDNALKELPSWRDELHSVYLKALREYKKIDELVALEKEK